MKICFAGPEIRINIVKKTIELFYGDIEPIYLIEERAYYCEDFVAQLLDLKGKVDIVIFTGEFHFVLYNKALFPYVVTTYIRKDWSTLQNALLGMSLKGIDLTNVSIDSYSPSMVNHLVQNLDIEIDKIKIIKRRQFSDTYSDYLFDEHKDLYDSGRVKGCITAMYTTYVRLLKAGIPTVYANPTTDVVVKCISEARKQYLERVEKTGDFAILIIEILPKSEYSYIRKDEYLYMHEKLKVAEEIFFFARDTKAAIVSESIDRFTVLISRNDLITYTNNLQNFYLFNSILNNTNCNINIGIGYGFNPGEAKFNAHLAIEKINQQERNIAYIIPNENSVIGPLRFVNIEKKDSSKYIEDEQFRDIAEQSGISPLKFYELYAIIEKNRRSTFTATELAAKMSLSVRTVNRMLKRLESVGLARIISKKATGGKGRPSDVYEIDI